jgi:SanA protein
MLKKIAFSIFTIIVLFLLKLLGCNFWVEYSSKALVYNQVSQVPYNKVGLLLGTSPKLKNGNANLYFKYRINAAEILFKNRKVDYILVSGDNGSKYYNEPEAMRKELVARGIPNNRIFLDYAGFRTLDSVVRAKKIFGQNEFTIISQDFHSKRALFIAQRHNINAVAFNAKDVDQHYGFKTKVREVFARVKVVLDIIVRKTPKYLGEKVIIP